MKDVTLTKTSPQNILKQVTRSIWFLGIEKSVVGAWVIGYGPKEDCKLHTDKGLQLCYLPGYTGIQLSASPYKYLMSELVID